MDNVVSLSDFIAVIALIIALASAWYSRQSVNTASAGNKIALHQPRKDIYEGLLSFRRLFVGMDFHPTDEEIDVFYQQSVAPAEIYYSEELAKEIHAIYKRSWELYRYIYLAETDVDFKESKWEYINAFQKLGREDLN
jgi:hypothetical protein